ncbi:MAG: GGDEF domain-containing protein [Bacilli bacterium]|nr:GGDEF domain-containing protein [Bacilli bacterium]
MAIYSFVSLAALVIHLIVNFDVFFSKEGRSFPGGKLYLFFLITVMAFHVADCLWWTLYEYDLAILTYVDTSIYYLTLGLSIFTWGLFVSHYLERKNEPVLKVIFFFCLGCFFFQIISVLINLFVPILFEITPDGEYVSHRMRSAAYGLQLLSLIMTAIYTLYHIIKDGKHFDLKYLSILAFSLATGAFVLLQIYFKLLPLPAIGFVLGICSLHTFVVEAQRKEKRKELNEMQTQVAHDALTGMLSKHAYVDEEERINNLIEQQVADQFSVVMFDVNGLKRINDTKGHDAGDKYLIECAKLIQKTFKGCPVYRVGGDEFVAILTNDAYDNREELVKKFNDIIDVNVKKGGPIVSCGSSSYIPGKDVYLVHVFYRADKTMYKRKECLKAIYKPN